MTWQLMISIVPFVLFVLILAYHEHRGAKKEIAQQKKFDEVIEPAVKLTNELYEKKYGRPSPELVEEFPNLKVVK